MKNPRQSVIRSEIDLYELWQSLLGTGGFGTRSLWLLFLDDDGRPEPVIMPIDGLARDPDARLIDALASIVDGLRSTGDVASVAMLLSRPGPQDMTADDRRWARALRAQGAFRGRWPMHLATTDRIQVFAADDLVPSGAA